MDAGAGAERPMAYCLVTAPGGQVGTVVTAVSSLGRSQTVFPAGIPPLPRSLVSGAGHPARGPAVSVLHLHPLGSSPGRAINAGEPHYHCPQLTSMAYNRPRVV